MYAEMAKNIVESIMPKPYVESDERQILALPPHWALSLREVVPGPQQPTKYGKNIVAT